MRSERHGVPAGTPQASEGVPPVVETDAVVVVATSELVIAERRKHRDRLLRPLCRLVLVDGVISRITSLVDQIAADENRGRMLCGNLLHQRLTRAHIGYAGAIGEACVTEDDKSERALALPHRHREARRLDFRCCLDD